MAGSSLQLASVTASAAVAFAVAGWLDATAWSCGRGVSVFAFFLRV
jgi:hypothetical protein